MVRLRSVTRLAPLTVITLQVQSSGVVTTAPGLPLMLRLLVVIATVLRTSCVPGHMGMVLWADVGSSSAAATAVARSGSAFLAHVPTVIEPLPAAKAGLDDRPSVISSTRIASPKASAFGAGRPARLLPFRTI